jgi:hypothetical protein
MCRKLIMEVLMSNSREKQEEEEEEEEEAERGEDDHDDHEILKRRISTHPSYGLLVEAHLGCLKVLFLSLSLSLSLSNESFECENSMWVCLNTLGSLDNIATFCL